MSSEAKHKADYQASYQGRHVQGYQHYLKRTGEHKAILHSVDYILPEEFKRIGAGKSQMDILGVGSGGGQVDSHMLTLLQSIFPDVSITTEIVEPSTDLMQDFKALVSKTDNLQKIPFVWRNVSSEDYEKQIKEKGVVKNYDFIHMIQMLYYLDDCTGAITFFHSLLKKNGKLMLFYETANSGWGTLWKTYEKVLCNRSFTKYTSAEDIVSHLRSLGLKYEEHIIPNSFDITDCFTKGDEMGTLLLDFMTDQEQFHQCFTPEIRADILDLLRNKCSAEKDGRIIFDSSYVCIIVHA